jgi:hypothetical protein
LPLLRRCAQLSHDIFKIDNTELARVLTIIEHDSPNALSRKTTGDEVRYLGPYLAPI